MSREFRQTLTVSVPRSWDLDVQVERFALVYERYTQHFGDRASGREITSTCRVLSQQIGIPSDLPASAAPSGYPLTLRFTMQYSTRVGRYDISNYHQLFADYINSNLDKVVADLDRLELPVESAAG